MERKEKKNVKWGFIFLNGRRIRARISDDNKDKIKADFEPDIKEKKASIETKEEKAVKKTKGRPRKNG